jgi:hypothetical protein
MNNHSNSKFFDNFQRLSKAVAMGLLHGHGNGHVGMLTQGLTGFKIQRQFGSFVTSSNDAIVVYGNHNIRHIFNQGLTGLSGRHGHRHGFMN